MKSMMPDNVDPTSLTTVAVVAAITAMVGWMATNSKGERDNGKTKRRWSCMSDSLAQGTFPQEAKFNEAIINVVMVVDDNDRPSVDEIVEHCVKLMLQYERFSSIYDRKTSLVSNCGDELDPYDLVREIPVSDCSSDNDLLKVMEGQACVPLAQAPRGTMLPWWEFVFLKNTNSTKKKEGKSAVVWRIHHSLGKKKTMGSFHSRFWTRIQLLYFTKIKLNVSQNDHTLQYFFTIYRRWSFFGESCARTVYECQNRKASQYRL